MAIDLKKLELIQNELNQFNSKLQQYKALLKADGLVDTAEEKTIATIEAEIKKVETRVKELEGGKEDPAKYQKYLEMEKGLASLKAELESVLLIYDL
jgi:chromosome segregation ATPase